MTHGLPTIVGGGDGTEGDVIEDGVNGFIERSGDVEVFANRIEELLFCSDERWASYSRAAREAIQERANLSLMIRGLAGAVRVAAGLPPASEDSHEKSTLLECSTGGA
jgi:glycosyltransferase involved in cell wall biosynthesis